MFAIEAVTSDKRFIFLPSFDWIGCMSKKEGESECLGQFGWDCLINFVIYSEKAKKELFEARVYL